MLKEHILYGSDCVRWVNGWCHSFALQQMNNTTVTALAVVAVVWAIYLFLSVMLMWRLGILWGAILVGGATWFLAPYLRMTVGLASLALMADRMSAILDAAHTSPTHQM